MIAAEAAARFQSAANLLGSKGTGARGRSCFCALFIINAVKLRIFGNFLSLHCKAAGRLVECISSKARRLKRTRLQNLYNLLQYARLSHTLPSAWAPTAVWNLKQPPALLQSSDKCLKAITPYIAIDRHIEQNRSLYYTTLHQGSEGKFHDDSQKYKIEPLAWYFIRILRSSLSDIEIYRNRYARLQKLSESGLAVLNCFKSSPEKRLKVSDIEKDTGIPRRTVQYALQTLTKKEFIQKLGQKAGTRYQLIF